MTTKDYYSKIWLRLTGVFCLLIIVPMVILALVTISNLRTSAVNKIELSLGRLIDHKKEVVDLFLGEKENLLSMLLCLLVALALLNHAPPPPYLDVSFLFKAAATGAGTNLATSPPSAAISRTMLELT